jgi:hypothetical protein
MGFKKPLDYNSISHQIWIAGVEISSPRNDGYTAWEIKKELYDLQHLLSRVLKNSPTFTPEDDYLRELEKKEIEFILQK